MLFLGYLAFQVPTPCTDTSIYLEAQDAFTWPQNCKTNPPLTYKAVKRGVREVITTPNAARVSHFADIAQRDIGNSLGLCLLPPPSVYSSSAGPYQPSLRSLGPRVFVLGVVLKACWGNLGFACSGPVGSSSTPALGKKHQTGWRGHSSWFNKAHAHAVCWHLVQVQNQARLAGRKGNCQLKLFVNSALGLFCFQQTSLFPRR